MAQEARVSEANGSDKMVVRMNGHEHWMDKQQALPPRDVLQADASRMASWNWRRLTTRQLYTPTKINGEDELRQDKTPNRLPSW